MKSFYLAIEQSQKASKAVSSGIPIEPGILLLFVIVSLRATDYASTKDMLSSIIMIGVRRNY